MTKRYKGKHRPDMVRQVPYEEALGQHINAIDHTGKRYTTHLFAQQGDWWYGATILTRGEINHLKREGMLPLKEMTPI